MSTPFFAVDSERWPRMLARLRTLGPLEEDEARTDLRWLENEHRVWTLTSGKRGACFPGRRALEVRWGWPERKVRAVLAADDWHDPISPVPAAELRRSAPAVPATAPQTSPQASPQTSPPHNGQTSPIPEICPADVPAAAPKTSPSMSIARAFLGTTSTTEPQNHTQTAVAAGSDPEPSLPKWVPPRSGCEGHPRESVMAMVVKAAETAHGKAKKPEACGTAAKAVLALWRCLGAPDPAEFTTQLRLVAEWARLSKDPLAENDIRGLRANGERWGTDRSRDLSTLCVQDRWDARLAAAEAWEAGGRTAGAPLFRRTERPSAFDGGISEAARAFEHEERIAFDGMTLRRSDALNLARDVLRGGLALDAMAETPERREGLLREASQLLEGERHAG